MYLLLYLLSVALHFNDLSALRSLRWAERDAAQRRLTSSPSAFPAVYSLRSSPDAEQADRARQITRRQLDRLCKAVDKDPACAALLAVLTGRVQPRQDDADDCKAYVGAYVALRGLNLGWMFDGMEPESGLPFSPEFIADALRGDLYWDHRPLLSDWWWAQ